MRRTFIAGNWKMNTSFQEQEVLLNGIYEKIGSSQIDIAVCPPTVYITSVLNFLSTKEANKKIGIKVGAQNMHWEDNGAFTGEVSGHMLREIGCTYVVLGHSERRTLFSESNKDVNLKTKKALSIGLLPIVCIGETLEEREQGKEKEIIQQQLEGSLQDLSPSQVETCTIAYEPVWAIGTGKTATPDIAQEMHKFIRTSLEQKYGESVANSVRIQYGGSVKAANIKELISQPDIDGALIGGASLKADEFATIINICS